MKLSKLLLLTAALLLVPVVSFAAPELNGTLDPVKNKYLFSGTVKALATDGETLYLGGDFNSVSEHTGEAALFSESNNHVLTFPRIYTEEIDGTVYASVPDGDGGWYVGGSFTHVDGNEHSGIVHILSDGTLDVEFVVSITQGGDAVRTMVLSPDGETLYVGGGFSTLNGESKANLAALDAQTGELLPLDFDVEFTCPDTVYALELSSSGEVLYVGGDCMFTDENTSLAAFNTSDGTETSFDPEIAGPDTVRALALSSDDTTLYLGGSFTSVNDPTVRNRIAAVDAETGIVTPFDPNANGVVHAILLSPDEETLYVGGSFGQIGGQDRSEFAAIDTETGLATSLDANIVGGGETVFALGLSSDGGTIYIGGRDFSLIGGQERTYFGAIDAHTGVATTFNPDMNGYVYTIAVADGKVLVGGDFDRVYPVARVEIAAIDLDTYELTDFDPQITAPCSCSIYALALSPDGQTLYMGGVISAVNDGAVVRNNIAAVDTTTALATDFDPNVDGTVYALDVSPDGTTVYAGGAFGEGGGELRSYAAAFESSTGAATDFDPTLSNEVRDLVVSPDGARVYVAGLFADVLALHANDGSTLLDLPNNPNGNINALALSSTGEELYFGGAFTSFPGEQVEIGEGAPFNAETGLVEEGFPLIDTEVGETVHAAVPDGDGGWFIAGTFTLVDANSHFALLHVLADGSIDPNFQYVNPEINDYIYALEISSDYETLYLGGDFTEVDGTTRNKIAALDTATGAVTAFDPDVNGGVQTLKLSPDDSVLYAAGNFTEVNGAASTTRNYLAGFDTSTGVATAFDPNMNDQAFALEISSDGSVLYAGGDFTEVNGAASTTRYYLAGFDTSDGTATAFDPMIDGGVSSLELSSDDAILYVGGSFLSVNDGEYSRNGLAAFTTADSIATSFNPNPDDLPTYALSLSPDDSTLYVGGSFHNIGGAAHESAAAISTTDGTAMSFAAGIIDAGITIQTISEVQNGEVFMGGSYITIQNPGDGERGYLASADTEDLSLTDFNPDAGGTVRSLTLSSDDDALYVGGDFDIIGGAERSRLAAIDAESGTARDFDPILFNPSDANIFKVLLSPGDDELYVGGGFERRFAIFSDDEAVGGGGGGSLSGNKNNRSSGGGGGGSTTQGQSGTIGGSQEELIEQLRALIKAFIDAGGTATPEMLAFLGQGTGDYTRDLQLGDEGPDVLKLQLFLIAQNKGPAAQALAAVGATGYFGPLTQAALAEFQAAAGISPAAGYFGPVTKAFIQAL